MADKNRQKDLKRQWNRDHQFSDGPRKPMREQKKQKKIDTRFVVEPLDSLDQDEFFYEYIQFD